MWVRPRLPQTQQTNRLAHRPTRVTRRSSTNSSPGLAQDHPHLPESCPHHFPFQADSLPLSAASCVLAVVPMFHANSWGLVFAAPMVGAKLVLPGEGV